MKEKLTPYLRHMQHHPAISGQYCISDAERAYNESYNDPLMEDAHEVVKGLVHKYSNRALIKVSYQCAAHCRFCTRIRQIGNPSGTLSDQHIDDIVTYLLAHPEIDDVILSGGDPFYTPRITTGLLHRLQNTDSVRVLRIGSRMAVQSPASFSTPLVATLLETIAAVAAAKPFYILLHINHPHELTPQSLAVINMLRKTGATLLSQTVFLKDINDDYDVLFLLFKKLYHAGVMPYYIYRCDEVTGIQHFAACREKEIEIATRLRATLSGIACPTYIIDIPDGYGKIPVPLSFMNAQSEIISDFTTHEHILK